MKHITNSLLRPFLPKQGKVQKQIDKDNTEVKKEMFNCEMKHYPQVQTIPSAKVNIEARINNYWDQWSMQWNSIKTDLFKTSIHLREDKFNTDLTQLPFQS